MVDLIEQDVADTFAIESSGYHGHTACRRGLGILPGRYVQPHWRQRKTIIGGHGPDGGWHLSECCPEADVSVLDGLVHGSRIRLMLNSVSRRCIGMATADDIEAVHGIPVRVPLPSEGAEARRIVGELVTRLARAGALPVLIFGFAPLDVHLFWMLDGPDPIQGDPRRHLGYNALACRLAEAVGGEISPAPLLTDVPMPGVCDHHGRGMNTVLGALPGHPIPIYGTRFEDLEAVAERIEATPRCASAA